MLPSDPDYIPAARDLRVLQLPAYQQMLSLNTDPYAPHSFNHDLIQALEDALRVEVP